MKLVVVIPYFYPAYIYGGPVVAAYHLCQKVAENGVNVDVITTNLNGKENLMFCLMFLLLNLDLT